MALADLVLADLVLADLVLADLACRFAVCLLRADMALTLSGAQRLRQPFHQI